jgi:hypothetical protein
MKTKLINKLKRLYNVDKNDGRIRQIVWNISTSQEEYTRIMEDITHG